MVSKKRIAAVVMALCLVLGSLTIASAAEYSDIDGHWAKATIEKWSEYNIVEGSDGMFRPNDNIKRSEFATILVKLFGYTETASNTFTDVDSSAWYASNVLKLVAAGVMDAEGTALRPTDNLTRGEEFEMLCKAFGIEPLSGDTTFVDDASIPAGVKGYVKALQTMGIVTGSPVDGGNAVSADQGITRAELLTTFDRIAGTVAGGSGTYNTNVTGNFVVNSGDVALEDMTVGGDLYLVEGVGNGGVTLSGVTVNGNLYIRGGSNVDLSGVTVTGEIIIIGDNVKLNVEGETKANGVTVNGNGVSVTATTDEAGKAPEINKVTVNAEGATTKVTANDSKVDVVVNGSGNTLELGNGTYDEVTLEKETTVKAINGEKPVINTLTTEGESNVASDVEVKKTVTTGEDPGKDDPKDDPDQDQSKPGGRDGYYVGVNDVEESTVTSSIKSVEVVADVNTGADLIEVTFNRTLPTEPAIKDVAVTVSPLAGGPATDVTVTNVTLDSTKRVVTLTPDTSATTVPGTLDDGNYSISFKMKKVSTKAGALKIDTAAPVYLDNYTINDENTVIVLDFDKKILDATVSPATLASATELNSTAIDTLGGTVGIETATGTKLVITFVTPLTGNANQITVAAGAIKGENGVATTSPVIVNNINAGAKPPVISAIQDENGDLVVTFMDDTIQSYTTKLMDGAARIDIKEIGGASTSVSINPLPVPGVAVGSVTIPKASLQLSGVPIPEGNYDIILGAPDYKDAKTTAVIDVVGPKVEDATIGGLDLTTSPLITKAQANKIVIEFHEPAFNSTGVELTANDIGAGKAFTFDVSGAPGADLTGATLTSNGETVTIDLTGATAVENGSYTLTVNLPRITDAKGNAGTGSAAYTFTVATEAPSFTVEVAEEASTSPAYAAGDIVIKLNAENAAYKTAATNADLYDSEGNKINGTSLAVVKTTGSDQYLTIDKAVWTAVTGLDGEHTVVLHAAGYVDTESTNTVFLDNKPPEITTATMDEKVLDGTAANTVVTKAEAVIEIEFSEKVMAKNAGNELIELNAAHVTDTTAPIIKVAQDSPSTQITSGVTLTSSSDGLVTAVNLTGATLPAGAYTVTVDHTKLFDASGNQMAGTTTAYKFTIVGKPADVLLAEYVLDDTDNDADKNELKVRFDLSSTDLAAYVGAIAGGVLEFYDTSDPTTLFGSYTIVAAEVQTPNMLTVKGDKLKTITGGSPTAPLDGEYKVVLKVADYTDLELGTWEFDYVAPKLAITSADVEIVVGDANTENTDTTITLKGATAGGWADANTVLEAGEMLTFEVDGATGGKIVFVLTDAILTQLVTAGGEVVVPVTPEFEEKLQDARGTEIKVNVKAIDSFNNKATGTLAYDAVAFAAILNDNSVYVGAGAGTSTGTTELYFGFDARDKVSYQLTNSTAPPTGGTWIPITNESTVVTPGSNVHLHARIVVAGSNTAVSVYLGDLTQHIAP